MIVLGVDPGVTFGAALWGDRGLLWSSTLRMDAPGFTELEHHATKAPSSTPRVIDAVCIEASFVPSTTEQAIKALQARKKAAEVLAILKRGRSGHLGKLLENRGWLKGVLNRAIPNHFDWIEPYPGTWRKAIHGRGRLTKEEKDRGDTLAKLYDIPLAATYVGREVSSHESAAILLARFGHTEARLSAK